MQATSTGRLALALTCAAAAFAAMPAQSQEIIKIGVSGPMSGTGANWGKGSEFMCRKAAQEIKDTGGVKVKGKVYNFECLGYDNKYTSAEGTKVAQTLINRDGVRFMFVFGTPPLIAAQTLTERNGVLLFNATWAKQTKGPKFPLTFSTQNSPSEMMPVLFSYVVAQHPQAKTVMLLNANDPGGRDTEPVQRQLWEQRGVKVLAGDYYERGTTEFQPIANRLMSYKADIVDISTLSTAEAGMLMKELSVLGFKGVKVLANGNSLEGLLATGGNAIDGVYLAGAVPFDGPSSTAQQRKVNEEARAQLGESLGFSTIAGWDALFMAKAGIEKAQSLEPKDVAAAMPASTFRSFYGTDVVYGGTAIYGSPQQPLFPVFITQVVGGKLVERARVQPKE